MKQDIINELKKDIKEKKIGYNRNSIPSRYNTEQNYKKRYKGREILELIQNAEDANASELIFDLDKNQQKIIISNNGENFSLDGYRSLLYPNISSKRKNAYIGQKGLGFRALINWATKIAIISNNLKITFSKDLSNKLLEELKIKDPELQDIVNMEFLSIPKIEEVQNSPNGVRIELIYDETIDFDKQFDTIDSECFFFLKNLKSIKTPLSLINKPKPNNILTIEITEKLPEDYYEKEELENKSEREIFYNIKLVWNQNKNYKDFPLYTYFRTNVKIGSPILIHAGFDLSDDRNSIENTKRNRFLVDEICRLIKILIQEIIIQTKDWSAYKLLNHHIQCEYDSMFKKITTCFEDCKKKSPIYPSIDGQMKNINNIIILDNEIAEFIIELKKKYQNSEFNDFGNIAIPSYDSEIKLNIDKDEYYKIFNKLSEKIPVSDIATRVVLIKLFHKHANSYCPKKPAIFIDNNNEIIPEDDEVFLHSKLNFDAILIPNFCKYKTINSTLYREIINEKILSQEEIESCINMIRSTSSYTDIFLNLVKCLSEEEINELQKKEIYSILFKMYKQYANKINIPSDVRIPILCDNGKYYSENVIFNYGFNANDQILEIIENVIKQNDNIHCIREKDYWNFLETTGIELKNFFKFIKVSDSIEYEILNSDAELFVDKLSKEDIVKLAIFDNHFFEFIKEKNNITKIIEDRKLFTDYVIDTKKIIFLNKDLLDISAIKKYTNDTDKINNILKSLGAKDTIEKISEERFNVIIKNLSKWDPDGEFAGIIYNHAIKNNVKIKGQVYYYSKDKLAYLPNEKLYYYDNKCLPASKLKEFPTIDLGRRKGHNKVRECFNIKSIEDYKIKLIGEPTIENNLTLNFMNDLKRFYPLILAYRFCLNTNQSNEDIKKEQANALKNINIKLCTKLIYTFNDTSNNEILEDYDFINSDGIFYFKIPDNCKTIEDIRNQKKELFDFMSEMLLMTFKLSENNSYIKDTIAQTYIFNDLQFSTSRFKDDNDRSILQEAEEYLQTRNSKEDFWKHIHKFKKIEEDYKIWEKKQETKKAFSTLDYTQVNEELLAIFDKDDVSIRFKDFLKDYPHKDNMNFSEYNKNQIKNLYESKIIKNIQKYIWYKCKTDNQMKFFEQERNSVYWKNISDLFDSYTYLIEDFENEIWLKLKEKNYDKDKILEIVSSNQIDFDTIYNKNRKLYNDKEMDIIRQSRELTSLLYYENTEIEIKKYFDEKEEKEQKKKNNQKTSDEQQNWSDIKTSFPEKKEANEKKSNSRKPVIQTSYSSLEIEEKKIRKGQRIEEYAWKYLNNSSEYEEIENVSDHGLGYDFQCKEIATGKIIYVEVKSFSIGKGYFEITRNEYDTWKKYKDSYVFFLLDEDKKEHFWIKSKEFEDRIKITVSSYKCELIK